MSYLAVPKAFPSARSSDTDTMTITALEAITSSSGKMINFPYLTLEEPIVYRALIVIAYGSVGGRPGGTVFGGGELKVKGKGSPIVYKGRRGIAGFHTHLFSVRTALCEGGAYLLSVAALPLHPPKEGSYSFTNTYAHVAG